MFVGEGTRRELEAIDVAGRIALFDWRGDQLFWPALTAAELGRAGAVGAICTCLPGSRYYQADRALGSFDAIGLAGSPPLAYLRKEDAALVIDRLGGGAARLTIDADLVRGATAHNVVGVLPGRTAGSPIVIGGHHDCWFGAAFDDATGVAATLAIAKALVDAGYEPEHPIVFTSHTAEEYGRADSAFDWLIGAWWQIAHEHPEWQQEALLYVNIEGTGMALPTGIDTPPELRRFARGVVARARRDGLLRHGVAWGVPRTGTEQWPFAAAGVPSLGVADEVWDYMGTKYHTQYDDLSLVDPECLGEAVKFYARLVIAADRNPAALLELGARSRHLRRHGGLRALAECGVDTRRLAAALDGYEAAAALARRFAVRPAGVSRRVHGGRGPQRLRQAGPVAPPGDHGRRGAHVRRAPAPPGPSRRRDPRARARRPQRPDGAPERVRVRARRRAPPRRPSGNQLGGRASGAVAEPLGRAGESAGRAVWSAAGRLDQGLGRSGAPRRGRARPGSRRWSRRRARARGDRAFRLGAAQAGDGLVPRRVDRQERRDARDLRDAEDDVRPGWDDEPEVQTRRLTLLRGREQHPEHRRVDERALAEVDEHVAPVTGRGERFGKRLAIAEIVLAAHVDDREAGRRVLDVEAWFCRRTVCFSRHEMDGTDGIARIPPRNGRFAGLARGNSWDVAASYALNESAVRKARALIDAHQYVLDSDWGESQPGAEAQNAYLKNHSWDEYAEWHLGLTEGATDETKGRYAFVYGDFRRIHRTGLIACVYRAAEWRHKAVELAAHDLLQRLDAASA